MQIDIVSYKSIMGIEFGMSTNDVEKILGPATYKSINPSNHLVNKYLLPQNRLVVAEFNKVELGTVISVLVNVFDSDRFKINSGEPILCTSLVAHLSQCDKDIYTWDDEMLFLDTGLVLGEFTYKNNEYQKYIDLFQFGAQQESIDDGIYKSVEGSTLV
ncbi:hypothetical protein [Shewanella sp. 6_MG-2023]|uniref:hypothetical protein n=1 Tax=Shewanella sp. 6_MG-2023 TaxID=3062660 RepID=UPI0026E328B3|nr:hypothetical protein [Shewanella sp. 6_MG-2023]MDO6621208.1 hypothetical protein [Shewanella sp. 6_MG-2023]